MAAQSGRKGRQENLAVFYRLYDVVRLVLTDGAVPRERLAVELEVSTKTVGRYLQFLEHVGVVFQQDGRGNITEPVRIEWPPVEQDRPGLLFNMVSLSREELFLLYLLLAGAPHIGEPDTHAALWRKVRLSLASARLDEAKVEALIDSGSVSKPGAHS